MEPLTYENAHRKMLDACPELEFAYGNFKKEVGDEHTEFTGTERFSEKGDSVLQYAIFEGILRKYVDILLPMPGSKLKDKLLHNAFGLIETMLNSDDVRVHDLAGISMFEGRDDWWLARTAQFLGPKSGKPKSRKYIKPNLANALPDPEREIFDSYGIRDVIFQALKSEGIKHADVPGITRQKYWPQSKSLQELQQYPNGVVILWGSSIENLHIPYLISPANLVQCSDAGLMELAQDLANIKQEENTQCENFCVSFVQIAVGERIEDMPGDQRNCNHARWQGKLWMHKDFVRRGLLDPVKAVLTSLSSRLSANSVEASDIT